MERETHFLSATGYSDGYQLNISLNKPHNESLERSLPSFGVITSEVDISKDPADNQENFGDEWRGFTKEVTMQANFQALGETSFNSPCISSVLQPSSYHGIISLESTFDPTTYIHKLSVLIAKPPKLLGPPATLRLDAVYLVVALHRGPISLLRLARGRHRDSTIFCRIVCAKVMLHRA